MITRKFLGGKGGRRVGLTTLPPSVSRMSENVGVSNSHSPKGLHGLYRDNFTFTGARIVTPRSSSPYPVAILTTLSRLLTEIRGSKYCNVGSGYNMGTNSLHNLLSPICHHKPKTQKIVIVIFPALLCGSGNWSLGLRREQDICTQTQTSVRYSVRFLV
jgi:hypothetical protein